VGHSTAAEPSILWLAHRLGRRSLQKLTRERSQPKAATTEAKRKFNPRTDLSVGHYKNNPQKKHLEGMLDFGNGTIVEIGRLDREGLYCRTVCFGNFWGRRAKDK
jgi:hypothetical protein